MHIGVVFPQQEIGPDPIALRDYVQAVEALGYHHLLIYERVLTDSQMYLEPFVLFGYLAALTQVELVTAILILPQRQTVLVAKQAAQIDVLTGGKLRLGVGAGKHEQEFQALGMDFRRRGRVLEEQIEVLRALWSQPTITFAGDFHTIRNAGLGLLPIQRPIPIWLGGAADLVLRRIARVGDGWIPDGSPEENREPVERLRRYIREVGRDPATVGLEGRVSASGGGPDEWASQMQAWQKLGATHLSFDSKRGTTHLSPVESHVEALEHFSQLVKTQSGSLSDS